MIHRHGEEGYRCGIVRNEDGGKQGEIDQSNYSMDVGDSPEEIKEKKWKPSDITQGFMAVVKKTITWEMLRQEMEGLTINVKEDSTQTEEDRWDRKLFRERGTQTDVGRVMSKEKKVQAGGIYGDLPLRYWNTEVQVNRDLEREVRRVAVQTEDRTRRVVYKEASVQTEKRETLHERGREGELQRREITVGDVRTGVPRKTDVWRRGEIGLPLPTPDLVLRFPPSRECVEGEEGGRKLDPNPVGWIPGWGWSSAPGTTQPTGRNQGQSLPMRYQRTFPK